VKDSKPDFPQPVHAPKGAPNVVVIILDDVGYGCIEHVRRTCDTPTLDKLAQNGLRYTHFYTTSISSPTRASLLTGRNHHTVHTANIMELATGYPGYDSVMGKDTATVAETLRQKAGIPPGSAKNHNVPIGRTARRSVRSLADRVGFENSTVYRLRPASGGRGL